MIMSQNLISPLTPKTVKLNSAKIYSAKISSILLLFFKGETIRLDGRLLTRQMSRDQDIFDPNSAEINK